MCVTLSTQLEIAAHASEFHKVERLQQRQQELNLESWQLETHTSELLQRVQSLEALQFAPTTKLTTEDYFIIGGIPNYHQTNGTANNATTFNYDLRLFLDTSYSGRDLLRVRLRSDNSNDYPFGIDSSNIFKLDKPSSNTAGLRVDRFFYSFPAGDEWKFTVGALMQINDNYAFKPTVYNAQIIDLFSLAGAGGVYKQNSGPGFGAIWKQRSAKGKPYLTASTSFISTSYGSDSSYGLFDQQSGLNGTAQLGLRSDNWGIAVAYRIGTENTRVSVANGAAGTKLGAGQTSNNVAIGGYWQPLKKGWMPSISLGYGYTQNSTTDNNPPNSQSWALGLQWSDVLASGNAAGIGIGQPANATGDGKKAWLYEIFYRWELTDNISTTAALFLGTNAAQTAEASNLGGVIQTRFRF